VAALICTITRTCLIGTRQFLDWRDLHNRAEFQIGQCWFYNINYDNTSNSVKSVNELKIGKEPPVMKTE